VETVQTSLEFGTLEDHVQQHGHEAELVVVGKRGDQSADRAGAIGDHLERVLRVSPRPVLIAPAEPREIRRYIIAFDGGPQSGHAVSFLVDRPLLKGCEGTMILAGNHAGLIQQLHDAASHLRSAGHDVQAELGHGDPERLIPDILNTEDIDLLVMGAFGHSRLLTLFGRSTTRKLLRATGKAILVIR
jgi:nucleotide-binding universal stress UspA family protein